MRPAGCFMSWHWRCVRWQWSLWRPRFQQGLIITAQGVTLARITSITASGITAIAITDVTSRGSRAGTPVPSRRARKLWQKPASRRPRVLDRTGRGRLWCARFMNMVLQHAGLHGTGSDMARSFASYGQRVSGPQVGAIAVMGRRGGGHVGVVSGIDASGNPIVVSGNHGHRVAESVYPRGRIYAYVMPTG
jgi:uncharacterized protein (TIGR02594 family)